MSLLFKIAYQPYKWIVVVPFMILNTLILGLLSIIVGTLYSQDAVNILAVFWSRLSCAVGPVRVTVTGKSNYNAKKPYVIVANHQSMVDIPAVHGFLGLTVKWVMKKELGRIPVFGAACKALGCIFVDRSDHGAAIRSIRYAQKTMSARASVLFFAEGTRSRDGRVRPFKKGAFIFARETGLPVLPVTIKDTDKVLPSDSLDLTPGAVEIIVHPPLHVPRHNGHTLQDLIESVRATVIGPLENR